MSTLSNIPLVQVLGWTLVHAAWQATAIWILHALLKRVFRSHSSQTRYIVACFTLASIVASMAITFVCLTGNLFGRGPIAEWLVPTLKIESRLPNHFMLPTDIAPGWLGVVSSWISPIIPFIGGIWLLLVLWQLISITRGARALSELKNIASPIDDDSVPGWKRLCRELVPGMHVLLGELPATTSPFTAGWLKPIIILPIGLLTTLPPHQIEAILAHELAHIRRRDYLVNFLQSIAEILLFFHPCVRALNNEIRDLREHCCDDIAISTLGGTRRVYVESLIAVEEFRPPVALALGAGGAGGTLIYRVQRIARLQRNPEKNGIGRSLATITLLLLLAAMGADAAIQRLHDDRILKRTESRRMMDSIYDVLDANRDNPAFLPTVVPVLEKFRKSTGLSNEDADRLAIAISPGARTTEIFSLSKEIYLDGGLLTRLRKGDWKGGSAKRTEDLAEAMFNRAREMPPGPERYRMARAAMILAGQESFRSNSIALELMIREIDLEKISGLSALDVHLLRQIGANYQARIVTEGLILDKWARREDGTPPPASTLAALPQHPALAWHLSCISTSWPATDPRRALVIQSVQKLPVYGPVLVELIREADLKGVPLYSSSSSSILVPSQSPAGRTTVGGAGSVTN